MVYPIPNYTRIKVRGRFVDLAKAAREETSYGLTGPVQFIPTADVAINQGSEQIIDMAPFVVFPSAVTGYFEVLLPSTDDPDIVPTGWNYKVIEPTGRSYYIVVPYDTPNVTTVGDPDFGTPVIELSDVVPDPEANPGTIQLLAGPAGRGISTITISSGKLIGTYTDGFAWDAGNLPVRSVAGRTGAIVLTKSDVGLSNVDNTSDIDKPLSTEATTALAGKATSTHTHDVRYYTEAESDALLAAKAATVHTHSAVDVASGQLDTDRLPQVASTVRTVTGASGSLSITPSLVGNIRHYSATGNVTITPSITGATNGQVLRISVLASGGTRSVTFPTAVRTSTGVTRGPHSVGTGEMFMGAVEYSTLISAWVLTAATITAA